MKHQHQETLTESVLSISTIPLLLIPIILALYLEKEIDQLGEAFNLAFKYTVIPFFLIFFIILYFEKKDIFFVLRRALPLSGMYAILSVIPILLINNHLGRSVDYYISGYIIDKKPGRGKSKPYLTIKDVEQEISFRLPRSQWKKLAIGDQVSFKVKKGSLGLIYK